MAKVEFSGIVSNVKGSVGGTTFKGGTGSPVMMNKRRKGKNKIDIIKGEPNKARIRMQTVSKSWNSLTESERGTWNALKGVRNFKNAFGKSYVASSYQIYMSMNTVRLLLGLEILKEAPVYDPSPYVPMATEGPDDCETDWGTFMDCEQLDALRDIARSSEHAFIVQMTRGTNGGRTPERLTFNVVGVHYFINQAPICLTCLYATFFGVLPPLGSTVWIKITDMYKNYPVHQNERLIKWISMAQPKPPTP